MVEFNYSYVFRGKKVRNSLPYDPTLIGWKWVGKKNCCLYFEKEELKMRIKTDTQVLVVEKEGQSRPLLVQTIPFQSHKNFISKIVTIWSPQ